ncbi:MAG TPA: A24 family peptidase [Thermomicrobiaceae bacterium]|nr:A24 family peptidase [Thermomicrobiaceae bacterium]
MIVAVLFLGLLLGPPLNLLIDRLPRRLSLAPRRGPTCLACEQARPASAWLPLAGWLLARGRCERCDAPLPRRVLAVEAALPLAAAALWLRDAGGARFPLDLLLAAYFIAIVAIDVEHRLVLNRMTGAGLLAALGIAAVGLGPSLPAALIGAAAGFVLLFIPALLLPGLGLGDVKLAAVIGALVGFPAVFDALALGIVAGGLAAALLLVTRRVGRRGTMAYAPYLVVGVALVLFGFVGGGR